MSEFKVNVRTRSDEQDEYKRPELCKFSTWRDFLDYCFYWSVYFFISMYAIVKEAIAGKNNFRKRKCKTCKKKKKRNTSTYLLLF
jgi:hypothetical protein